MLRFSCDQCGKPYVISPEHAGKKTICVKCGVKFRIPGGSPSTVSTKSASAPSPSKPAAVPVPAQESSPPVDLDVYGLAEEPVAPPPRPAGSPSEGSGSNRSVSEDAIPPPPRTTAYKPLSEAKKKQIAKRAATRDRMMPSNASMGVSFGAVLAIALFGWRIYRRVDRSIERAAERANAAQTATVEDFDPKVILVVADKAVEKMIAEPSTAEARDWLDTAKYPNHRVTEMPIENAREMVAGFYQRGAEKVYILDPTTTGNAVITAQIGVKLPEDPTQRKQCLEWAAKYDGGGPPSLDQGQKYLVVTTD
jgi:hypothetical protein